VKALRIVEAKFELLVSIHGAKEIGDNKVKMMPYGSREITIPKIVEKSLFMVTTMRTSRRGSSIGGGVKREQEPSCESPTKRNLIFSNK
jgi:hypothetical protein